MRYVILVSWVAERVVVVIVAETRLVENGDVEARLFQEINVFLLLLPEHLRADFSVFPRLLIVGEQLRHQLNYFMTELLVNALLDLLTIKL